MTTTRMLYEAAGQPPMPGNGQGVCRLCGIHGTGQAFDDWVKDTFNDWGYLCAGSIICHACLFTTDDRREDLATRVGKDKPQRMRNYSHFVVNGEWLPLSKGDKTAMRDALLRNPQVAIIAVGGQKHIVFKAKPGWWQIEEQSVLPFPDALKQLLAPAEDLYNGNFSKTEIESGNYIQRRILDCGLPEWHELEAQIKIHRGGIVLELALFLAQKREDDGSEIRTGAATTDSALAGTGLKLQEPLRQNHLATIRGQHPQRGLHVEPIEVPQLSLFPTTDTGSDGVPG